MGKWVSMVMADIERALPALRGISEHKPAVAIVLGSGLGALADEVEDARSVAFGEVEGMVASGVAGHRGRFVAGRLEGTQVVMMQGRLHLYEGHRVDQVVFGVRLMIKLGASTLIVTNASGGLERTLGSGSLLAISDHINLTGQNCLVGSNDESDGPRFPDMTDAYDGPLRALAHSEARALGFDLYQGVYVGVLGPSYETPAEVRMLRGLGASVVGMSTVQEVLAARHLGARVLGISCVTNLAAGLGSGALTHSEVQQNAEASAQRLCGLIRGVVRRIGEAP